ncbi:NCS2 family permease [Limosilactobacillus reuteri]|uniref:NCS2 family permease n=1 Tax=Limosilactobacillus reuteri TaxID=1598 RepID=A0A7L6BKY6_LIMRT|nr:NCS2 family permease [Limosilactobacillus reuteri]QLQ62877.1 NCS2 family permease [Limosilactobacillus reuteri]
MEETRTIDFFDRTFHLSENNTNIKQECLAGLTTFVSMVYILFVNPSVLGVAGMDKGAVFTATALSAIIGCFLMGILANYPIAITPGLGDNAFFTYSVVLAMGIPWQKAMAAGIGIFISFVGLQGGGIIVSSKSSLVELGSLTVPTTWITIFGIFLIAILMVKKVPGAIFIGLVVTTLLSLLTGLVKMPDHLISMAPSLEPTFGVGIKFLSTMTDPKMWAVVLIFLLVAFFDTAGTLVGLAQEAGLMKDNKMPRIGRALMADSLSMLRGVVMGTTPTSAYVEPSAGIAVGGKTGLTAIVTGTLFILSMAFSPLLEVVTTQVTAAALIVVGVLMVSALKDIEWDKFEIALPSFLVAIGIPLTYNISYGIAFGFLTYPILMVAAGRRKEVNVVIWSMFFVFIALLYILNILLK